MIGMGVEVNSGVRVEAADFFCDYWAVTIPSAERVGDVPRSATIMRKASDWNISRISMLEVEAVPQNCIP
jgi:hypothetical protein